jgi:hypothetical protein
MIGAVFMVKPEIRFEYLCPFPYKMVEVIANGDGTGVLVIDLKTDEEVDLLILPPRDQRGILAMVKDWANHYDVMSSEA